MKGIVDQQTVLETIKSQINENDIVLYMKGTKEAPQCGFSSAVACCFFVPHTWRASCSTEKKAANISSRDI